MHRTSLRSAMVATLAFAMIGVGEGSAPAAGTLPQHVGGAFPQKQRARRLSKARKRLNQQIAKLDRKMTANQKAEMELYRTFSGYAVGDPYDAFTPKEAFDAVRAGFRQLKKREAKSLKKALSLPSYEKFKAANAKKRGRILEHLADEVYPALDTAIGNRGRQLWDEKAKLQRLLSLDQGRNALSTTRDLDQALTRFFKDFDYAKRLGDLVWAETLHREGRTDKKKVAEIANRNVDLLLGVYPNP